MDDRTDSDRLQSARPVVVRLRWARTISFSFCCDMSVALLGMSACSFFEISCSATRCVLSSALRRWAVARSMAAGGRGQWAEGGGGLGWVRAAAAAVSVQRTTTDEGQIR